MQSPRPLDMALSHAQLPLRDHRPLGRLTLKTVQRSFSPVASSVSRQEPPAPCSGLRKLINCVQKEPDENQRSSPEKAGPRLCLSSMSSAHIQVGVVIPAGRGIPASRVGRTGPFPLLCPGGYVWAASRRWKPFWQTRITDGWLHSFSFYSSSLRVRRSVGWER